MGCGVGDPPNAKTIIKKKKKIFALIETKRITVQLKVHSGT